MVDGVSGASIRDVPGNSTIDLYRGKSMRKGNLVGLHLVNICLFVRTRCVSDRRFKAQQMFISWPQIQCRIRHSFTWFSNQRRAEVQTWELMGLLGTCTAVPEGSLWASIWQAIDYYGRLFSHPDQREYNTDGSIGKLKDYNT